MWLWLCLCLVLASPVESPIALAAQLAGDGNTDRALSALQQVDPNKLGKEEALYRATVGLIALQQQRYPQALEAFQQALVLVEEGQEGPQITTLYLYIGQCHLLMSDPQQALAALARADLENVNTHLLIVRAHRDLQDYASAWQTVDDAVAQFPSDISIRLAKIDLALGLNQLQSVREEVAFFSASEQTTADVLLRIAQQCREQQALSEAALFLQAGRYRFSDEEIWKASAIISLQQERWVEAGEILQVMALQRPEYAIEAAEAYRQADLLDRAFLQNSFAPPSPEKTSQRLSLLLEQQEYERALALEPRVRFWELSEEDSIRYGLAYAYYQTKDYTAALAYLKGISDQAVFQQAIGLRRAIEGCQRQGCP